jgi:hypothetical protein
MPPPYRKPQQPQHQQQQHQQQQQQQDSSPNPGSPPPNNSVFNFHSFADDLDGTNVASLETLFHQYASISKGGSSGGPVGIDSSKWMKLCVDATLIDSKFTKSAVDIVFTKFRNAVTHKIDYKTFLAVLKEVALRKGFSVEDLTSFLLTGPACAGPHLHATVAGANKFHDDQSLYTGVHKAGGPTTIDVSALPLCDRSESDVRGIAKTAHTVIGTSPKAPH